MKFSLSFFKHIPWQQICIRWYIPFFIIAGGACILFSVWLFYGVTHIRAPEVTDAILPKDTLSIGVVEKIKELLDARSQYFNTLRATKATIKNPY